MRAFDEDTVRYWSELLEVGLENTPARDKWKELEKMVATFFPGRGTLFEETYLEGQAKGLEEGLAKGLEQGREEGREEGVKLGRALGSARAMADAVLCVFQVRGLPVPGDVRMRVITCDDVRLLGDWLARAVTVSSAADLFTGEGGPGGPAQES